MIAFFDANALIYLIEGAEPFAGRVRGELASAETAHPGLGAAVSRLSWLECRVRPMRCDDQATLARYDGFFNRPDLIWVELNRDVVELATVIRVRHGLRTPDALQAACCLQLGPDHLFFTGDDGFKRVAGLNVRWLS
ncbi:MAG: type II toxin-antitoxin system VapC family toxin [Thiobacillus sp.]|nr:type II toxin-antitoxin system VapC family toxin [Thiobacillus sp.]